MTAPVSESDPSPPLNMDDPPPPYPSRERRTRAHRTTRRTNSQHLQLSSADTDHDTLPSPRPFPAIEEGVNAHGPDVETPTGAETTPLLIQTNGRISSGRRPRTLSYTSTLLSSQSAAPSLAHTLASLFQPEPESDTDNESSAEVEGRPLLPVDGVRRYCENDVDVRRRPLSWFSSRWWKRYFRPMMRMVYYKSLFHLMVLNFPFALAAWVYLFVFTLTGTTLLMALPLGAILCFFDLLGARMFARGELALQTRFHSPLAYPLPYPPRPIFTRFRDSSATDAPSLESGLAQYETSFYKNTYSMFTDSTSYQALFYFLVIKPGITLLLSVALLVVVPTSFVLILPAPAVLCAVRRLGIWQANVAVEGLYIEIS